jgi:hypothetical protein
MSMQNFVAETAVDVALEVFHSDIPHAVRKMIPN